MSEEVYHIPALLPETLEGLSVHAGGRYLDATYGGGGHSRAIADIAGPSGHLYALDQDEEALRRAQPAANITLIHGNFRYLTNYLDYLGVDGLDGILADLGVSFHHFDDPGRGFSFRWDGPLDMRMNRRATLTAADILREEEPQRLAEIFKLYGEFRNSRQLAEAIARARVEKPVENVEQLVELSRKYISPRQEKKELAQIFQALRIEVNHEIDALRDFLSQAAMALKPGGRLAVITYHSLEDRLVKNFMKSGNFEGKIEKDFYGNVLADMKLLNSKAITASEAEVEANPRSRSAKLRIAVKL